MLIALISDIHDNISNLRCTLSLLQEMNCQHLFCMGDIVTLPTFLLLRREWKMGIDIVFGNNEYNHADFMTEASHMQGMCHHGDEGLVEIAHRKVYLTHYPQVASQAAISGLYDAVFLGIHIFLVYLILTRQSWLTLERLQGAVFAQALVSITHWTTVSTTTISDGLSLL